MFSLCIVTMSPVFSSTALKVDRLIAPQGPIALSE